MRRLLVLAAGSALVASPAWGVHKIAHTPPAGAAPVSFASDFTPPKDSEWGFDIGGFGGETKGKVLVFNPVIFVHGNSVDHTYWEVAADSSVRVDLRRRLRSAGYSDQEIWALSYNGATCGSGSLGACATDNDRNVSDLYAFMNAVFAYTGTAKVDIVAHSLGVTLVRKTVFVHPELLERVEDFVGIAGGNHGTTACRGNETSWIACDEVAPETAWLATLNSWNPKGESDETPGPIRYMTVYDGSGTADTAYMTTPFFDDSQSPRLSGAYNRMLPGTDHASLARGGAAVGVYLPFIMERNNLSRTDSAPPGLGGADVKASALAATGPPWPGWLGPAILAVALGLGAGLGLTSRRR